MMKQWQRHQGIALISGAMLLAELPTVALGNTLGSEMRLEESITEQRWGDALTLIQKKLSRSPNNQEIRFQYARVLAWSGDYASSRIQFQRLLKNAPRNLDYINGLARLELWAGEPQSAVEGFEKALKINPRQREAWQGLMEANQHLPHPNDPSAIIQKARRYFSDFSSNSETLPHPDVMNVARGLNQDKEHSKAATILREHLNEHPHDLDARFLLANSLAWAREFKKARIEFQTLMFMAPENAEILEGAANVELWDAHPERAIPIYERAIRCNPENPELYQRFIAALEDNLEIERAESERTKARQLFPNLLWERPLTSEAPGAAVGLKQLPETRVFMGGSYEVLNHGYADWSSTDFLVSHRPNETQTITGGASEVNRYGLTDAELKLGATQIIDSRWVAGLETNDSPTNHFLPIWSVRGSLQYLFDDGWSLEIGYRRSAYRVDTTNIGTVNLEKYIGDFRLGYVLFISHIDGTNNVVTSSLGSASYYYDDRNYVGLMIGQGTQPIVTGPVSVPSNIVYSNTQTYVLRGEHWLDQNWALAYDAGVNIQGDYYTRYGFNLGVRYAF